MPKASKGRFPPNVKELLLPLLALGGVVVLIVVSITNGTSRISKQKKDLVDTKNTEAVLEEKESELRRTAGSFTPYINTASIALPDKNPVLYVIVQTRSHAETQNVALNEMKVNMGSGRGSVGISGVGIHVDITGSFADVINFMRNSKELAPLTTVDGFEMDITDPDNVVTKVSLNSHWSLFPSELPAIITPIDKITQEEISILQRLAGLIQPEFTILTAQGVDPRGNPFSF